MKLILENVAFICGLCSHLFWLQSWADLASATGSAASGSEQTELPEEEQSGSVPNQGFLPKPQPTQPTAPAELGAARSSWQ